MIVGGYKKMYYAYSINLYTADGVKYDDCVLVYCGTSTLIRFEDPAELKEFAQKILKNIKQIEDDFKEIENDTAEVKD